MSDLVGTIEQQCMEKGFVSGYVKTKDPNGLYLVYGFSSAKGPEDQPVERDSILDPRRFGQYVYE